MHYVGLLLLFVSYLKALYQLQNINLKYCVYVITIYFTTLSVSQTTVDRPRYDPC